MSTGGEGLVAQGYDAVYRAVPEAPTLWQIWAEHAAGIDYPAEFSHISFITLTELQVIAAELRLNTNDLLVDLACGMAGPSLWIATQLPIRVSGIDASAVAVEMASARADRLGLAARSNFTIGTFATTRLGAQACDAVLSLDALQYAPNKQAAIAEIARILKPGRSFAFSAFEVLADRVVGLPVLGDDPLDDYRPLLERNGFDIDSYDETQGWDEHVTRTYEAIIEHSSTLSAEMGADAFGWLSLEVGLTLELQPYQRRVLAIATRR